MDSESIGARPRKASVSIDAKPLHKNRNFGKPSPVFEDQRHQYPDPRATPRSVAIIAALDAHYHATRG